MTTREACARHLADWWDHQEAGLKLFLEGRLTPQKIKPYFRVSLQYF